MAIHGCVSFWHIQQRLSLAMQPYTYNHVATVADHEVSQSSYMAWSSKQVKRQQAHVVIESNRNILLTSV